jgi:tRNA(Ile)-lysidine synthase
MPSPSTAVRTVERQVRQALRGAPTVVLAVSGGVDSMVLLHAAARARSGAGGLLVATFDHRTGRHSSRASGLVASTSLFLGVPCVIGVSGRLGAREADWREARWEFLREVAGAAGGSGSGGAVVATAHNLDDQVETVFIRALRHAGPRGLAGLYAPGPVLRPLLAVPRSLVREYAGERGVAFLEDPTNLSRMHLRNRVRLDLLPRIAAARPEFPDELLGLSRRASAWRTEVEQAVDGLEFELAEGELRIPLDQLAEMEAASLRILWPALAGRAGVAMDWRGTHRLAEFTIRGARGRSIQLSGRVEVVREANDLVLRRWRT